MTEFHAADPRTRQSTPSTSLQQAQADGDDYLVEVRTAELETLARLAARARPATCPSSRTTPPETGPTPPLDP